MFMYCYSMFMYIYSYVCVVFCFIVLFCVLFCVNVYLQMPPGLNPIAGNKIYQKINDSTIRAPSSICRDEEHCR